ISAVSIKLMPSSILKRSAATSLAHALLLSPMRQVPCPSTETRLPSGSATVLMSIQSHLESGRNLFSTNLYTRVADYPTECDGRKIASSLLTVFEEPAGVVFFSARLCSVVQPAPCPLCDR